MNMHRPLWTMWLLGVVTMLLCTCISCTAEPNALEPEVMFAWSSVDYDWPSNEVRNGFIRNRSYIEENNDILGIKVFNDTIYVTVPRLKFGVPSTLNVIVGNVSSANHVLRPFPSWEMQTLHDCYALQFVQAIEIDPNTGYMWIVDTGCMPRKDQAGPSNHCPAKLVIYDLANNTEVHRHTFPRDTIGYGTYLLSDIVLQYYNGTARWAYISDSMDYKLIVYDHIERRSYYYSHPNMMPSRHHSNITISNITITDVTEGISGLAMAPDFRFLYYSSVAGVFLYQIPTEILTSAEGSTGAFAATVRRVGSKVTEGKAMSSGVKNNIYYSALGENAVYKWNVGKDSVQNGNDHVILESQSKSFSDPRLFWANAFALDESGNLWCTSTSELNIANKMMAYDVGGQTAKFFIWKVKVDDFHYLFHSWRTTITVNSKASTLSRKTLLTPCFLSVITFALSCLL